LAALDATGCTHEAARIIGVDARTVRRYVAARDAGQPVSGPGRRERLIHPFVRRSRSGWRSPRPRCGRMWWTSGSVVWAGAERTTRRWWRDEGAVAGRAPARLPAANHPARVVPAVPLGAGGRSCV